MKCTFCNNSETKVLDSRESDDLTRRRRECLKCEKRFTTYERVESVPVYIIKKDGSRELFDREKLRKGLIKSCEKRPVSIDEIENVINRIESKMRLSDSTEISSKQVGEEVMNQLKSLDKIAYIRFASVYRDFADIEDFKKEIKILNRVV
ncbi:MAG TPA: transcriptional repressor NrdR [Nanoarchaeota archaeon]|nr:MAG: transcriptional repressor NrdR [archaeon GW2011_AR18]HIH25450.1 transcriptional repressor NrdR [Nanoarchaeota archaeon]